MVKCALSLPARLLASALLIGVLVAGCTTTDGTAQGSLANVGSSLRNSVGQNTDANGTNRRPDVQGNFTRPTLPSIANQ
ncbi:MAG TPA: hypothetical protein VE420_03385 [Gemmatimonadales bacterium]|nr:hypothetical protein [Gemmatimonadales bacterium]